LASQDASLKRLRTDCIDLHYQRRAKGLTQIENGVGRITEMIAEIKVKHSGLLGGGWQHFPDPTPCGP
jgi:aryl-alcohol dehydrogenase-like predicted oxidoreductase